MSAQIVSSIAQSLSELSLGSVETGLDKVRCQFGASRVSLALFGATGVEMLASVGRPLLANGVQVANDASSLFMSASHGLAFGDEDLLRK